MEVMIQRLILRFILNSRAEHSVEAEITLKDGSWGRGSAPAAILAGKREKKQSDRGDRQKLEEAEDRLKCLLYGIYLDQEGLDCRLRREENILGSDICLAVSLAFARGAANAEKVCLTEYLRKRMRDWIKEPMGIPGILVPLISGGVHSPGERDSFQQIMIALKRGTAQEACQAAGKISRAVREALEQRDAFGGIAASGGCLARKLSIRERLQVAQEVMEKEVREQSLGLALDIAGEHLAGNGRYHLSGRELEKQDYYQRIFRCLQQFPICYLEDPFDPGDTFLWKQLKNSPIGDTLIFGDDIFATQAEYMDDQLAMGAIIKMNQVGTLTSTLETIRILKKKRMLSCISHRSCETEDTALCDLAVASAADFIKIGALTRGERIIKYNQLLRLESIV